jgi:hypothetical protein
MAKWGMKLWRVHAGLKYECFVVAKTELTALKIGADKLKVPWLKPTVEEIPIDGYELVERGDKPDAGANDAKDG